jgi:hypothetical protein
MKEALMRDEDEAIKFFNEQTKSIEIQFNEDLLRVYFPVQPICQFLNEGKKNKLMAEVPRESPNDKVEGLVDRAEGVFDELEHLEYLQNLPVKFSQERLNFLHDLSIFLSFAINILMLATYHIAINPKHPQFALFVEELSFVN